MLTFLRRPLLHGHRRVFAYCLAAGIACSSGILGLGSVIATQSRAPSLSLQAPAVSTAHQGVGATATLRDQYGLPLAGQPVTLEVDSGSIGPVTTDSSGNASFAVPGSMLSSPGSYALLANYVGGAGWMSTGASATVQVASVSPLAGATVTSDFRFGAPSLSLSAPAQSTAGLSVGISALLKDQNGGPMAGASITFQLNSSSLGSATTNAQGVATFTIPGSSLSTPGAYQLRASYQSKYGYGARANATLNVLADPSATIAPTAATAATRQAGDPIGTRLIMQLPTGTEVGQDVSVNVDLKDGYGNNVPGQHVSFLLDGQQLQTQLTNATGQATFGITGKKLNQAGPYTAQAVFRGSHGYGASSVSATMTVLLAAIQIQTVPPLPGLSFTLNGVSATTGPSGTAALPIPASGIYRLTDDLNPDSSTDPVFKASFVRWADGVLTANRDLNVTGPAIYTMGLRVAYQAQVRYVDQTGKPIPSSLVDQARFQVSGDQRDVSLNAQSNASDADVWWTAGVAQPSGTAGALDTNPTLQVVPVTYLPVSVTIHGNEALKPGQKAWAPTMGGTWTISLNVYQLYVEARDAVFGSRTRSPMDLHWADGAVSTVGPGPDGRVLFSDLPAGRYRIGVDGWTASSPMALDLSGSANAVLHVVTLTDVVTATAAALGLLSLAAAALLKIHARRRRGSPAVG